MSDLSTIGLDAEELGAVVLRALDRLVGPDVTIEVTGLALAPGQRADRVDAGPTLVVTLRTSDRARLLGQYAPFTVSHGRGYHDNYVFGYVHGYYHARHGRDLWEELELVLDVRGGASSAPLYGYLAVSDALAQGRLAPDSPLAVAARRHEIRYLGVAGSAITGPSPAMMSITEREVRRGGIDTVLDLYSGTCALSRVALAHGATRAVCIDTALDEARARETLAPYAERAQLLRADVGAVLDTLDRVDLALVDPFYDHTLVTLEQLAPRLARVADVVVVNLGADAAPSWTARVNERAQELLGACSVEALHGEVIAVRDVRGARR